MENACDMLNGVRNHTCLDESCTVKRMFKNWSFKLFKNNWATRSVILWMWRLCTSCWRTPPPSSSPAPSSSGKTWNKKNINYKLGNNFGEELHTRLNICRRLLLLYCYKCKILIFMNKMTVLWEALWGVSLHSFVPSMQWMFPLILLKS